MTLVELLLVRRYTINDETMKSYQTLVGLAQTSEFRGVTRLFSKRAMVEALARRMCDNHRPVEPGNA